MKKDNIIDEYIEAVKKEMTTYLKIIYKKNYNIKISEEFIENYINERYCNITDEIFWQDRVAEKFENIQRKYQMNEVNIMGKIIKNIIMLDKLKNDDKIQQTLEKLKDIQFNELNIKVKNYVEIMNKTIEQQIELKQQILQKYKSDIFTIKKSIINEEKKIFNVTINHHIKFDNIYSKSIINEVFNEGVISEDILLVEYNLISLQVLQDILNEKLNNKYVVKFKEELLKKKSKQVRILKYIDNEVLKEKIILATNTNIIDNNAKEEIYELMRMGFKFAFVIDEKMKISEELLGNLNSFVYIITNQENFKKIQDINNTQEIKNKILINN